MKPTKNLGALACFAALLFLTSNVSALTVGRIKGVAILGQPLDVVVSVQLATQEDLAANCVDAAVFYGDVQQSANGVKVSVKPASDTGLVLVSITSSALVDEPSVTVSLRAGCSQKTTRRYVLLSELLTDLSPGIAPKSTDTAAQDPSGPSEWQKAALALAIPAARAKVPASATENPVAGTTVTKPQHKAVVHKNEIVQKASVNMTADRTGQIEDLQRRVDALAQRDIPSPAQDDPNKYGEAVASVQTSLQSLQTLTVKNQQALAAINRTLDARQDKGSGDFWLYGFAGLLGFALLALIYFLVNARAAKSAAGPWWNADDLPDEGLIPVKRVPVSSWSSSQAESTVSLETREAASGGQAGRDSELPSVDIELGEFAASGLHAGAVDIAGSPAAITPRKPEIRAFAPSGPANLQAVNIREMLDVRQQAEFFLALGQHSDAIELLERSIEESNQWNPLVLLDLLGILHTLGRRADFDRYRQEFNTLFTGLVPMYPDFLSEGNGLESYPQILLKLESFWPNESAAEYIESCLVRTPQDKPYQGFDLDAFRDLLLLHGILRRLDAESDSNLAPFSTQHTPSNPVSLGEDAAIQTAPTLPFLQPEIDDRGLDLDLDFPTDKH